MKLLLSFALIPLALIAPTLAASAQSPASPASGALSLNDLLAISLHQNPALAQADLDIQIAQGRAVQAGLYFNPTITVIGDELGGSRGQQGGIITAPMISQEIIAAGKRKLDIAIANRKMDQTTLALVRQQLAIRTAVRQSFYEVLAARRRSATLDELTQIAAQSYDAIKRQVDAKQAALLDLLQVQVEHERILAERDAARREATAAWRRLGATVGVPNLQETALVGNLDTALPAFDYDQVQRFLVEHHPEVTYARVGITHAELTLRRQQVESVPNVTVGAGYVRQNQDKMDLWMFQVEMPVPVFNRNQGNIQAARAEVGRSIREVDRVQNELTHRFATAFGNYSDAKGRSERYRQIILPAAKKAYEIAFEAFKGGQFEYLRVLQAQRSFQEATLEYVRALGEAWRAASEIEGMLLKEE